MLMFTLVSAAKLMALIAVIESWRSSSFKICVSVPLHPYSSWEARNTTTVTPTVAGLHAHLQLSPPLVPAAYVVPLRTRLGAANVSEGAVVMAASGATADAARAAAYLLEQCTIERGANAYAYVDALYPQLLCCSAGRATAGLLYLHATPKLF